MRKPKTGFFLPAPASFKTIGEGTARGSYAQRKAEEAAWMARTAGETMEVVFPGVIYTAEDALQAIRTFVREEVDCVLILFLSWSQDFALNRFLRDMPPIPILYAWRMRDHVALGDTHDEDEFAEYLCCGGLVGALEGSGDVARYQRPLLRTSSGTWPELLIRLHAFANAARARALLKESHVGLLASYNEIMWSTYVDLYSVWKVPWQSGQCEDYVSGRALTAQWAWQTGQVSSVKTIAESACKGDAQAQRLFAQAGRNLGAMLQAHVRDWPVEKAVIGGQIAKSWHLFASAYAEECSIPTTTAEHLEDAALWGNYAFAKHGEKLIQICEET